MIFSRSILLSLVCPILLMSCTKAEAFVWDSESLSEVVVLPDSISRTLKIAIIGDSISSFKGSSPSDLKGYNGVRYKYFYPQGDVKSVESMWWYKVARALSVPIDNVCNCSWSGSRVSGNSASTTSASVGCSTRRIKDLSAKGFEPDIVFCFISCNDWANNVPLGLWTLSDDLPAEGVISTSREAYALMIAKIRLYYPSCLIFCLTNLDDIKRDYTPGWPSDNRRGVSVDNWNKSIVELSKSLGCYTIDLQDCGIDYDNLSRFTVDGLHPNDAGMTLIANKVYEELAIVLEIALKSRSDEHQ